MSSDRNTMVRHFNQFISNQESPGLVIVQQKASIARVIEDLFTIWADSQGLELRNQIRWVPFPNQLR